MVNYEKEYIYEYHNLNQLDLNKGIETVSNTEFIWYIDEVEKGHLFSKLVGESLKRD